MKGKEFAIDDLENLTGDLSFLMKEEGWPDPLLQTFPITFRKEGGLTGLFDFH